MPDERLAGLEIDRHAFEVETVVERRDVRLPLGVEIGPILRVFLSDDVVEFLILHDRAKLAEAIAIARMGIEKLGRGPAPGIRFAAKLLATVERHHLRERKRAMIGDGIVDQFDAAQHRHFVAAPRHDAERQLAGLRIDAMRAEQLGRAFHVPTRAAAAEEGDHERVRAFVQQQVAAIVIGRLVAEPHLRVDRDSVLKLFVTGRQQTERGESATIGDEKRMRLPVGRLRRIDAEIGGPLRNRFVEFRRQAVDRRLLGASV